jgi:lipid kinase YegS
MLLVINGKSSGDPALRAAVAALREKGVSLEVRVTWEGGDAARYAAEAVNAGLDVVIAGGGDGTINEVVNGMMAVTESPKTALGIIPYGTANDFATGCGIAKGDPLAALNLAAEGTIRNIDVGKVNDRYFVNVASGGFGARVTAETPIPLKNALGGAAYSLMGLVTAAKMTPYQGKLILPEGEERGAMILMAIGNGRLAGGGYQVTPRAILNDGLLDAMAVVDVELKDLGLLFTELSNLGSEENRYVVYRQMKKFRIEADQPVHVNLDGEPILETTFDFDVLPQKLPAVLPEAAPLANPPES